MSVADDARQMLELRLKELQPYLDEAADIRRMLGKGDVGRSDRAERVPLSQRRERLLKIVAERPGIKVGELAAEMGLSGPRVVQILNQLEQAGDVDRSRKGVVLKSESSREHKTNVSEVEL